MRLTASQPGLVSSEPALNLPRDILDEPDEPSPYCPQHPKHADCDDADHDGLPDRRGRPGHNHFESFRDHEWTVRDTADKQRGRGPPCRLRVLKHSKGLQCSSVRDARYSPSPTVRSCSLLDINHHGSSSGPFAPGGLQHFGHGKCLLQKRAIYQ